MCSIHSKHESITTKLCYIQSIDFCCCIVIVVVVLVVVDSKIHILSKFKIHNIIITILGCHADDNCFFKCM